MKQAQNILNFAIAGCILALVVKADESKPDYLIGYTEGRNDIPDGQFANWITNRACIVNADGTGRRLVAEELTKKPNSWNQFAGWSPDGKKAVVLALWESPENAAWEREQKTFRMTEGWLADSCLLDLATGTFTRRLWAMIILCFLTVGIQRQIVVFGITLLQRLLFFP